MTILRLSGIVGPDRDPTQRVRSLAGQTRSGGNSYVNLIDRDTIVESLTQLLPLRHHGVLNLSRQNPVLRRDYYDQILSAENLPPIQWTDDSPNPTGKRVDSTRIRNLLNLD